MTKLLGALLIISSGAGLGVSKYLSIRLRADTLYDIVSALELMRGEICLRLTPLSELMDMLKERGGECARRFFGGIYAGLADLGEKSFSAIWDESASALSSLSRDDLFCLCALGACLGRFEANEQEAAIGRAIAQLSSSAERTRESLKDAGKLYIGLGAGLCAMAAAVLI